MSRPRKKAGFAQSIDEISSVKKERLGQVRELADGRTFVYCLNGAVDLAAGIICCTAFTVGMNEQTVTVAHPIGTKVVTMTSTGATTAGAYVDGTLVVTAGVGIGESYKIIGNTAAGNLETFQITLETGLKTAWVIATTDITVYVNKYNGVLVNPTDAQQAPVCVTQRPVTASYYFWGQVSGDGAMLLDVPGAGGLETDEKVITPSLNVAGTGYIDGSPDAAAAIAAMSHVVGYTLAEADHTNAEAALVNIKIGL